MAKFFELHKRSITKTLTYRIAIIISTFTITFIMTGRIDVSFGVTIVSNVINTLLYYIHERMWNKIHWGKSKT